MFTETRWSRSSNHEYSEPRRPNIYCRKRTLDFKPSALNISPFQIFSRQSVVIALRSFFSLDLVWRPQRWINRTSCNVQLSLLNCSMQLDELLFECVFMKLYNNSKGSVPVWGVITKLYTIFGHISHMQYFWPPPPPSPCNVKSTRRTVLYRKQVQ